MAGLDDDPNGTTSFEFTDLPEDAQLSILSFLTPSEIAAFACTSKRVLLSLYQIHGKLWFSMCDRRWGSKTQIKRWGCAKISYKRLYSILSMYEDLIGFWRPSGQGKDMPPLVFFEWSPSSVIGSRVLPSRSSTYGVRKAPFLSLSVGPDGELLNFLNVKCSLESTGDSGNCGELGFPEELVQVNVSFLGENLLVLEENPSLVYSSLPVERKLGFGRLSNTDNERADEYGFVEDAIGTENELQGGFPEVVTAKVYQCLANLTSPSGDRKQRKREKERQGKKKLEREFFVKIVDWWPTPSRPLQGLWKGICSDRMLDFYLVTYDGTRGITCRSVGDSSKPFSGYFPVFWTSNTKFIEPPFSSEEEYLYKSRIHIRPAVSTDHRHKQPSWMENDAVSRILYINSSYDVVIPDLVGTTGNPQQVEGRIWQYEDGTWGFGFLRDNCIIDLKHISQNGCILDAVDQ